MIVENWMGQIQIKVDDKGRLTLPSHALTVFKDKELVLSVNVYQKKTYIELMNPEEWDSKMKAIEKLSAKNPKVRAYKRFLVSGSAKISLDKQNRIIVPGYQREMIDLSNEAVLVNLEEKIELWSMKKWQETSQNFVEDFEDLENWINEEEADLDSDRKSDQEKDEGGAGEYKSAA